MKPVQRVTINSNQSISGTVTFVRSLQMLNSALISLANQDG